MLQLVSVPLANRNWVLKERDLGKPKVFQACKKRFDHLATTNTLQIFWSGWDQCLWEKTCIQKVNNLNLAHV